MISDIFSRADGTYSEHHSRNTEMTHPVPSAIEFFLQQFVPEMMYPLFTGVAPRSSAEILSSKLSDKKK